jgi:hypothetical protein
MSRMKHIIAMVPFLAAAVAAQDDVYSTLATGDRVQVTFRSGGSLVGTLVPPPAMGPAASMAAKPKRAVDLKAAGAPFMIQLFKKMGDPSSEAQVAVIETWKKEYPEATVVIVPMEDKASAELIKANNVLATPTIVLRDTGSGRSQAQVGLQSSERLTAAIARLRARLDEEKVDYVKAQSLTLDVRLEYPGLNGTMSLSKKDIREVRKLQKLDEQTRKRLEEEHRKIKEIQSAEEAARRDLESKKSEDSKTDLANAEKAEKDKKDKADEGQALLDKAAKITAQEELLKQFPPDKWSEDRRKEIINKSTTRLPVSPEEKIFLEKAGDWAEAVKADKERRERKEKENAPEEKK